MRTQVLCALGMTLGVAAACLGAESPPRQQPPAAAPAASDAPGAAGPAPAATGASPAADPTPADSAPAPAAPAPIPAESDPVRTESDSAPADRDSTSAAPSAVSAPAEELPLSQQGLARLADATREQQQAWLRELKRRLDRALNLTLSPKKAAARQAEIDAALRRPTVDWDTLRSLVDELERRERLAIDTLERRCRVAIFNHFRLDTQQSDARHEILDRVFEQWRRSGKTPADRDAMIAWLEAALESCTSGGTTPMPADPRLAPTAQPAPIEPPPASDATAPESSREDRPTSPLAEALAGLEPLAARAEPTVAPDLLPVRRPGDAAASPPERAEVVPAVGSPSREVSVAPAASPSANGPTRGIAPSDESAEPPSGGRDQPSVLAADPSTNPDVALRPDVALQPDVAIQTDVALHTAVPRAEAELPAPPWQPSPGALEPPRAELVRGKTDDAVGEVIGRAAARGAARVDAEPPTGTAARTPPATGRPPTLPTDVALEVDAPRRPASEPIIAPEPAPPPADVNLADLAARIAGANLELRGLEAELIEEQPWDVDRLERAVGRLELLAARLNDLARYQALVPAARRPTIPAVESPRFAVSRLGNRIHQARNHAAGTAFPGTADQRREQLDRLDALSRRLAELVARDEPRPDDSAEPPGQR